MNVNLDRLIAAQREARRLRDELRMVQERAMFIQERYAAQLETVDAAWADIRKAVNDASGGPL